MAERRGSLSNFVIFEDQIGIVSLKAGDTLTLDLEENGTTGYSWQIRVPDALRLIEDTVYMGDRPGFAGSASRRKLSYEANAEGLFRVEGKLRRPWDADTEPLKTLSFALVVETRAG